VRIIKSTDTPSFMESTQNARVFVVSNRGPAQFHQRADGRSIPRPTSGGLATALVSAAAQSQLTWIAVAGNEADRHAFAERQYRSVRIDNISITTRYVPVSDRLYRMYYDDVSNRTLWFLQHYLFHADKEPNFTLQDRRSWEEGYVQINRCVAATVVDELRQLSTEERKQAIVLVQDYHMYLVPGMIREQLPNVRMGHFVHIPWPSVRYWNFIPAMFTQQIMQSMVCNDFVGLQTAVDVDHFTSSIQNFLPDVSVRERRGIATIDTNDRQFHAKAYPIGIHPQRVQEIANSNKAQRAYAQTQKIVNGRQIILRVDRVEPTKNIVRGLLAFELLLDQHPELVKEVCFVLMLVPSREGVTRYRRYATSITKLVQKINDKFGEKVVINVQGNNQGRALAAMREYDVMLVNSIIDGMHLGAKEGAVVNENDGVLVISRTAGVYQEMENGASLGIVPTDIQETADSLYKVLREMTPQERHKMSTKAARIASSHTVIDWLADQLKDLQGIIIPEDIDEPVAATIIPCANINNDSDNRPSSVRRLPRTEPPPLIPDMLVSEQIANQ